MDKTILRRIELSLIGGLAGLCLWLVIEHVPDWIEQQQFQLLAIVFPLAFFATLLGITGPLSIPRASLVAALVSLPTSLLLMWSSMRFADYDDYLETGHPLLAFAILITIPLPFLIAQMRDGESWRDYPALFSHAWNIVVRYLAAWMFTGLFWGVLMLSDALLEMVGITLIQDLLDFEPVPFVLTGLALGLGLAVMHELADYISPVLTVILRLLRLLLPMVLLVVVVFLLALPLRGLSGLFGKLSAAMLLVVIAGGAATLITTALDQSDDKAVSGKMMRLFSQALSLLIAVMAALAAYAVWLRVAQYGWTPNRIGAVVASAVGLGYGVLYGLSVLRGAGWMERLRRANIYMSFVLVGFAALWLTPLLNAQRISTNSQVARFEAGLTKVSDLSLWEIDREWGLAGHEGIERLTAMQDHRDYAALNFRLVQLEKATNKYRFRNGTTELQQAELVAEIMKTIHVLPAPNPDAKLVLGALNIYTLRSLNNTCASKTLGGNAGCLILFVDMSPIGDGPEAIIFSSKTSNTHLKAEKVYFDGEAYKSIGNKTMRFKNADVSTLDALIAGDYSLKPVTIKALHLNGQVLSIKP